MQFKNDIFTMIDRLILNEWSVAELSYTLFDYGMRWRNQQKVISAQKKKRNTTYE